ncbi:hypothetical protein K493DRAFT_310721 [Basidiobolus meristosporus CBS 931.73]|uniref:Homeobox domain-containing protein n=1 Tax=Basidiobolus meristosporus CBS 931.73 TaxID=1314790 RepID=A0A1Y1Z7J5_9FUNG|nr:hypothetical protein K493DRAFT_310721 [Basidiobolus meristosporus CBS 931.73]|eukprot:ORY06084.1 hypothetical protein K493DRAFT_310721 [Basidiobolus meristosporus CBS 931.73]
MYTHRYNELVPASVSNYPPTHPSSSHQRHSQSYTPGMQRNDREFEPSFAMYRKASVPTYVQEKTALFPNGHMSDVDLQRYHPYDKQYFPARFPTGAEESNGSSPIKPKRKRANANQLKVLNQLFQQTFFPSTELRIQLGKQLGMSPRTVQIWFQNKRQAWRIRNQFFSGKGEDKLTDVPSSPEACLVPTPVTSSPKSATASVPKPADVTGCGDFQLPPIFNMDSPVPKVDRDNSISRAEEGDRTKKERPLLPSLSEIIKQEPRTIGAGSFYY